MVTMRRLKNHSGRSRVTHALFERNSDPLFPAPGDLTATVGMIARARRANQLVCCQLLSFFNDNRSPFREANTI